MPLYNSIMDLVSPVDDYAACAAYAKYLQQRRDKSWANVHAGARWEMAWGHKFGISTQIRQHLERVADDVRVDFLYDFTYLGIKFDPKATYSMGTQNGLMLKKGHVRRDVIYLLGECLSPFPLEEMEPRPLTFRFVGWSWGDPTLFHDSSHLRADTLCRSPGELLQLPELVNELRKVYGRARLDGS